jgi:hypothetical protein
MGGALPARFIQSGAAPVAAGLAHYPCVTGVALTDDCDHGKAFTPQTADERAIVWQPPARLRVLAEARVRHSQSCNDDPCRLTRWS